MFLKAILVLCAQALLVQCQAIGSCSSRAAVAAAPGLAVPALAAPCGLAGPPGLAYNRLAGNWAGNAMAYGGLGYAPALEFSPTSGGALPVSSASAMAPVGISVASDNVYEGALAVAGELPFVGTVAMEGVVPSAGAGAVNHACGNGRNAMISENAAFAPAALGLAAPLGYPAVGLAGAIAPAAIAAPGFGYRAAGCANNFANSYII